MKRLILAGLLMVPLSLKAEVDQRTQYRTAGGMGLLVSFGLGMASLTLRNKARNIDTVDFDYKTGTPSQGLDQRVSDQRKQRRKADNLASYAFLLLIPSGVVAMVGFTMDVEPDRVGLQKQWRFK